MCHLFLQQRYSHQGLSEGAEHNFTYLYSDTAPPAQHWNELFSCPPQLSRLCAAALSLLAPLAGCLQDLQLSRRLPFGGGLLGALTSLTALQMPVDGSGLSAAGSAAVARLSRLQNLTLSNHSVHYELIDPKLVPVPTAGEDLGCCGNLPACSP